jgi:hypothetical protein
MLPGQSAEVRASQAVATIAQNGGRFWATTRRANNSRCSEDLAEKVRFRALLEEYFFAYRANFERLELGYDNPLWTVQARAAALVLKTTGGAEWWNDRKAIFGQEFAQEMEKQARPKDTIPGIA